MFDIDDLREHADASIEEGRRVIADARRRVKPGLDSARASAEPYLARATAAARHQAGPGFDQAQAWLDAARKDPRVVRAAEGAETVAALVVGAVSEYVVKPAMAYGQEHGPGGADDGDGDGDGEPGKID